MQPTARAINLGADKFGQNQKHDARKIHRQGAPADPAIINQTRDHKCQSANCDPVCLLSPEIYSVGICARGSRTVDCHNTKDGKCERGNQQKPILAKQFSKKRCHAAFCRAVWEFKRIIRKLRFWQSSQSLSLPTSCGAAPLRLDREEDLPKRGAKVVKASLLLRN